MTIGNPTPHHSTPNIIRLTEVRDRFCVTPLGFLLTRGNRTPQYPTTNTEPRSLMAALSKVELRRSLLQTRLSLSTKDWRGKSAIICHHLLSSPLFTQAQTVLSYFSFRQEPDLSSLFSLPKRWGFPRCVEDALSWHYWTCQQELKVNRYGIPEPKIEAPRVNLADVDLVLVPGVGCDRSGYRLGYGGGYYDRLFSETEWQTIPKIGIIFDFAYLTALPIDAWDIPLTGVCTEAGLFFSKKPSIDLNT